MRLNIILLFIIFMIPLAFSYNSSYDNITLKVGGWCSGIPLKFRILNATQYSLYPNLDDSDYQSLSGFSVVVYNGPFESYPILTKTITDSSGYFTVTFPEPKQYLIEIGSKDHFNELSKVIPIEKCDIKINKYNLSFINYSTLVLIKNSEIDFKYSPVNFTNVSVSGKSLVAYKISLKQDFKYDDIIVGFRKPLNYTDFSVIYRGSKDIPVEIFNNLLNISSVSDSLSNYVLFSFSKNGPGIYILRGNKINLSSLKNKSDNETKLNSSKNDVNNSKDLSKDNKNSKPSEHSKLISSNHNKTLKSSSVSVSSSNSDNSRWQVLFVRYFLIALLIIIIIAVVYTTKSKKKKASEKNSGVASKKDNKSSNESSSSSSSSLEDEVREYIRKYKEAYSRDQIFRALKKAGVDIETISKLLDEEY